MNLSQHKAARYGVLFAAPSLIGVFIFYVFPFMRSLYYTFTQGVADPHFVGFANFHDLLTNPLFRQAAWNTFLFLMVGVTLLITASLFLSVIAAKRPFRWQRWFLLLPMTVPASSMALGWQSIWGAGGIIGQLLGVSGTDFLAGNLAFPLLLLLYLLKNIGFLCVIFTSAIQALPSEYEEIYILESSCEAYYVVKILLPLISPTVLSAGLLSVMNYFLLFRDIYTVYADTPPKQLYMLQHFMNSNFYQLNYQRLSTAAFLLAMLLIFIIVAVLLLQRRHCHVV